MHWTNNSWAVTKGELEYALNEDTKRRKKSRNREWLCLRYYGTFGHSKRSCSILDLFDAFLIVLHCISVDCAGNFSFSHNHSLHNLLFRFKLCVKSVWMTFGEVKCVQRVATYMAKHTMWIEHNLAWFENCAITIMWMYPIHCFRLNSQQPNENKKSRKFLRSLFHGKEMIRRLKNLKCSISLFVLLSFKFNDFYRRFIQCFEEMCVWFKRRAKKNWEPAMVDVVIWIFVF